MNIAAKDYHMRSKVLSGTGERRFAIVFDTGDEVVAGLTRFAEEQKLDASSFTAIGAFSSALLGYFDWEKKDYERIPVREQVEVLALVGDIALQDGRPKLHAHVVLGKRDGSACGGHLLEARVRPTLEVILSESPSYLKREHDPASGLALIRIER
jgi:predicted DNA-binding protein with PD1-like motif